MALPHPYRAALGRTLLLLIALPTMGQGQAMTPIPNHVAATSPSSSSDSSEGDAANDMDSCFVHRVTSLPGSHQFASDFIEAIADDPSPDADPDLIWALTADLSNKLP